MSADMSRRSYSTQPQRPPAGRPSQPARPAPLANGSQRQTPDEADRFAADLFEKNAAKALAPTDKIPALLHASEIPLLRTTYTTGQGRLDVLTKLLNARLDFYYQQRGQEPFDPLTPEQDADARQFFGKHGMRLAGDKPVAPPNPIKAAAAAQAQKPAAQARAAELAQIKADAQALRQAIAQESLPVAPAAPPATPAQESKAGPAPASPVETPKPAADSALLAEVKALRGDVAGLRQVLELIAAQLAEHPAAPAAEPASATPPAATYELKEGESFRDFWMESLNVGFDPKSGNPTYTAVGYPYIRHGVRVFPEIVVEMGFDPAELKPGVNKLPRRVRVRAVAVAGEDGSISPRKVVGLAG